MPLSDFVCYSKIELRALTVSSNIVSGTSQDPTGHSTVYFVYSFVSISCCVCSTPGVKVGDGVSGREKVWYCLIVLGKDTRSIFLC